MFVAVLAIGRMRATIATRLRLRSPTAPRPSRDQLDAGFDLRPDVRISALISFAASAERWASARTSCATTAKPRPASPARAASTPAFRARRLVWKAISSITLMISPISREICSIRPIAATASRTIAANSVALAVVSACPG